MKLYAESSAVLAWLFGEPAGDKVRAELDRASLIIASELTLVECERALSRRVALRDLPEAVAQDRRAELIAVAGYWNVLAVHADVTTRARAAFPVEPVRTLDALHLASALVARARVAGLAVLSLDARVRENAVLLGFDVVPTRA